MTDAMMRLKVEDAEREEARKAANFLDRAMMLEHVGLFLAKPNGERLVAEMPPALLRIIRATLATLAEVGEAVLLNPEQEISPEKAAEILGISRPMVYRRMDVGKLPYREVGKHRRVRVRDVLTMKEAEDRRRAFAAALSADTEDLEANYAQPGQSAS